MEADAQPSLGSIPEFEHRALPRNELRADEEGEAARPSKGSWLKLECHVGPPRRGRKGCARIVDRKARSGVRARRGDGHGDGATPRRGVDRLSEQLVHDSYGRAWRHPDSDLR